MTRETIRKRDTQLTLSTPPADKVGYWITPPEIYKTLDKEFGFDCDPCPYPRPEGYDGLQEDWGQISYVNPPFTNHYRWVNKALQEVDKGKTVVMVYPVMRDILKVVKAGAEFRPLDVHWLNPRGESNPSSWPTVLIVLRPHDRFGAKTR